MKPFNQHDWIYFSDMERCPYGLFQSEESENWIRKDNQRLLLLALDRYTDYLQEITLP